MDFLSRARTIYFRFSLARKGFLDRVGLGRFEIWSGKRDLNPQPSAWEADTLPLSYSRRGRKEYTVERETGFEPATSTLARLHSTTELLPHGRNRCIDSLSILVNKEIG